MKKHLLLILALLAFVLPARAATELLFNFTQNSNGSDQGTSFSNNANVTAVISDVSYGATHNVTDYVASLTNVSYAYYNSKGGLHLGPNGTVTVNLKKTYKVTGYEVMGPTTTQHSIVNTSATVTVNDHTYTGVNAAGSVNWNRVQYEPTATENVSSFTIKAGNTDVYIKSIHIYLEAETNFTAPKFVPNGGRVKKGQTITVVNCEPSRLPQMDVTYGSNNVADHTGDFTFTFEETGTFNCWATAHSNNWAEYSEQTDATFEVYEDATPEKCATPVFTPASGTFGAGKEITVTCSTPGATITVVGGLDNNESFTLTSGQTFKLPNKENTYNYAASATATGYTESETAYASYTVQWPTCEKPVFNPNGGTVAPGTVVTLTCATAGAEITYYPADNEDDFNLVESGHSFPLPTTPGTYTYKAFADASATFYGQSETVTATYTVTAPVHNEVAPKISFSPEDQKVFGSEEEIDVTLTLNHDVYPVPNVIYYTLDGFMAHNTLETGTPGATPAGHVHTVAVDPSTLSGTVRIERSHREVLNHRAVTINAYTFNTAGSDVAAATYIFNDNAATQTAQYVAAPKTASTPTTINPKDLSGITNGNDFTVGNLKFNFKSINKTVTNTSSSVDVVKNNNWTISTVDGSKITSIQIPWTSATQSAARTINFSPASTDGASQSIAKNATSGTISWTGSSNSVKFTFTDAGKMLKLTSFVISIENSSSQDACATPAFDPEAGTYEIVEGGNKITISSTDGSTIHYKDNGGTEVTGPSPLVLTLPEGSHSIEAWATKDGLEPSSHVTKNYKFVPPFEGEVFTLVTSADQIKAGDKILITSTYSNANYVAGSIDNKKFAGISINALGQEIESKENYNVLKVVADGTDLYLQQVSDDKYISHSSADLSAVEQKSNNCKVEFVKGSSSNQINTKFTSDSRYLIYRNTSGNNIFGSYASSNLSTSGYAQTFIYRNGTETVKTPEIALNDRAGDTTKPVTATISCSTDGADVHYSVKKDDVETVADELYSAALTFNEAGSYELTAWATKEGMTASAKVSKSFTITVPVCQAPAFEPLSGAEAFNSLTVKLSCATEGAQIQYKVNNGEQKVYDANTGIVLEGVGSYTITAWATKEGMTKSAEVTATYTVKAEPVEELFFVMDQNLWDVDGAYPETVVPFEYKGNNTYDLEIASIPAKGWYMNKDGIWTAIEHGFRGNFYVRDGKANHKGLVFGATGTVADATFATRAAAAGNQMVEPHTKYNMYVVNEGETHKVFTTIDDKISKAFSAGTIRVTHTPGNKDAAKTMTLEILAEDNQTTGVDSITAEDAANDADARFFNLQGVEVPADRLAPGIYIRQAGSKATKVLVK